MTYGLILGTGDLPKQLVESLKNNPYVCVTFSGNENTYIHALDAPQICVPLGYVGTILNFFKEHHVTEIVIAGGIKRPHLSALKADSLGREWLKKLSFSFFKGDDGLLKGVIKLLENEGFKIISVKDVLPDLSLTKGVQTKIHPTQQDLNDIEKGIHILDHMADLDIGQALVIEDGLVLGLEAIEGTQALVQRTASLKRLQKGGVLVKKSKVNQSRKADLPTIGIQTIIDCYEAGLNGLAIDADGTQIIDKDAVIEKANAFDLFLLAV